MNRNEKLIAAGLAGLLLCLLIIYFWGPIFKAIELLGTFIIMVVYGRWLYINRALHYWVPGAMLLGCLLLTGLIDAYVFQQAEVESYSAGEGWISEVKYQSPNYVGEYIPFLTVFFGPLLGLTVLSIAETKPRRKVQVVHYLALLVTLYPIAAVLTFSLVEGDRKPRYYDGTPTPLIGTKHVRTGEGAKW